MNKQIVNNVIENNKVKPKILKNAINAFLFGGGIALMGESFLQIYQKLFNLSEDVSRALMSITLILLACILTGIGIYDKIGQPAGAGTIIPITGFSNSMTSAALESKSEGIVLGILTNMFKLAGAVIAAGVISAFIVSSVAFFVGLL